MIEKLKITELLNEKSLEFILTKCSNIKSLILDHGIDSSVLSVIGQYCPHIKSLKYHPRRAIDHKVLSFFRMYGHKLEELNIFLEKDKIPEILKLYPNLKNIYIVGYDFPMEQYINYLPELKRIGICRDIDKTDVNRLEILCEMCDKTMKKIKTNSI